MKEERFNDKWRKRWKGLFVERDIDAYIILLEQQCESDLKSILTQLGIQATVKTDRYSLPYQKEIIAKASYVMFLSRMLEHYRPAYRIIVKELLINDVKKIRFYFYIEESDLSASEK